MRIVEGNATTILSESGGILCHQVNCQRVAGAGVALAIRRCWPKWYSLFRNRKLGKDELGRGYLAKVQAEPLVIVADLYGQEYYGHRKNYIYTNYAALACAIMEAKASWTQYYPQLPVYLPYMIGCGNGGGDWKYVLNQILIPLLPDATLIKYKRD